MKILHVTPQAPNQNSGGGMGVYQTALSLIKNGYLVDYVGPEIEDKTLVASYNNYFPLKKNDNKLERLFFLIRGITNSRYKAWKRLDLNIAEYDVVVMDFTKLDYIQKKIGDIPFIVKVHNVEFDYARNDFKKNGGIEKKIIAYLAAKQERKILNRANGIMTLTINDKKRIDKLYGNFLDSKMYINPVCIYRDTYCQNVNRSNRVDMLITGSLWYGDNVDGTIWFIKNVFSKLKFEKKLVIAGARPNQKLVETVNKYKDIELIDSPEDMKQYFEECKIVIAPVFEGAGMKVKVAEALSYGKPVLGTKHAFIGYDIENMKNSFVACNAQEFLTQLNCISEFSDKKWTQMQQNARILFDDKYNIDVSVQQWRVLINNVIKNNCFK